eukprot:1367257-Amphidinium_carterae.1
MGVMLSLEQIGPSPRRLSCPTRPQPGKSLIILEQMDRNFFKVEDNQKGVQHHQQQQCPQHKKQPTTTTTTTTRCTTRCKEDLRIPTTVFMLGFTSNASRFTKPQPQILYASNRRFAAIDGQAQEPAA